MKKIIIGIGVLIYGMSEGMLVPYGSNTSVVASARQDGIMIRPAEDLSTTRSTELMGVAENQEEIPLERMSTRQLLGLVNLRQVRSPLCLDGMVQISVRDFIRSDNGVTPVGRWYTRSYPLEKTLLRYEHDFVAGFSRPVQELFATVTDVEHADRRGKIVVEEEFIDDSVRIQHQRRSTGAYEMDDEHLQAKPFTEIVIYTGNGEQVIDAAKVREDDAFVAYTRTDTPAEENMIGEPEARADDAEFSYQRKETLEDWRRPDTTIFRKRTESWEKVAKPSLPPPVTPPALGPASRALWWLPY